MDAIVDDGFFETLPESLRPAHDVLRNYGFYIGSTPIERLSLLEAATPVSARPGQVLMESGYACAEVLLLGEGRLRVFIAAESGREVTLYYVHRGESCPVNVGAALMGVPACADAAVDTALSAVSLPAANFRKIAQRNAELQDYALSATVLRFGEIIGLIRKITTKRVDQRLAEYLLRKFDGSKDSPPVVTVTHQNIALELGTAREVVTRRLRDLAGMGVVKLQRGKIQLRDRSALHAIIG